MRLILIRHGDPDYEKDWLTEKGLREAELLARRTKNWKVDRVLVSSHGRARATALPSLKNWNVEPEIIDWAREFVTERGIVWDFLPEDWAKEDCNFNENEWVNSPRGEAFRERYEYVCSELDKMLASEGYERDGRFYRVKEYSEKTIVVFCHFGVSMIFLSHLINLPALALLHGVILAPTSVTVLNSEERAGDAAYFRAERMGDTSHLFTGGEKISQSGFFAPLLQEV